MLKHFLPSSSWLVSGSVSVSWPVWRRQRRRGFLCLVQDSVDRSSCGSTLLKFKLSYLRGSHSSLSLLPLLVDNSIDCSSCSITQASLNPLPRVPWLRCLLPVCLSGSGDWWALYRCLLESPSGCPSSCS